MREVGFVKWFGAYDSFNDTQSNYGFIERLNNPDIFVHLDDVINNRYLFKDELVTFEEGLSNKNNKPKAIKVKPLRDEDDLDLIKKLAFNSDKRTMLAAFPVYLNKIDFAQAKLLLKPKLEVLPDEDNKISIVSSLSLAFFKEFNELRSYLNSYKQAQICLDLKTYNFSEVEKVQLYTEYLHCIIQRNVTIDDYSINKVPPKYYHEHNSLREILPAKYHFNICLEILNKNFDDNIFDEIIDIIQSEEYYKTDYYDKLPDFILIQRQDLRSNLSFKKHLEICIQIINDLILKKETIPTSILEETVAPLKKLSEDDEFWDIIPIILLESYSSIRLALPFDRFINLILKLLTDNKIKTDPLADEFKEKIKSLFESGYGYEIFNYLKEPIIKNLLLQDNILEILPDLDKLKILFHDKERILENEREKIITILSRLNHNDKERIVTIVPNIIFFNEPQFFKLLTPVNQIEIFINNDYSLDKFWPMLNDKAKLYVLYYYIKSNLNLDFFINKLNDVSVPLQFAIKLVMAKNNQEQKDKYFLEGHNDFQNYVVEKAWNQNALLDFEPLLPSCKPNIVKYCETRPWPTPEDKKSTIYKVSRAYCPRARKECDFESSSYSFSYSYSRLSGARLFANLNLNWNNWSILEIIEYSGIKPKVSNLSNSLEYVPRLSGWINRLNEIRERLKCSKCGEPLIPNQKYAKNLARYNMTVASCSKGKDHDNNIYFNHCWACREIIDSRESKIQIEGLYLCILCGSGPQQSQSYTQGDICPKCGEKNITSSSERDRICNSCNHKFTIPSQWHLTGKSHYSNKSDYLG